MKVNGTISQAGLAEVLRRVSKSEASGLLSVESQFGRKILEIRQGNIAIAVDGRSSFRLGDLLVARGKITELQLEEGLRVQRQRPGRPPESRRSVRH